MTKIDLDESKFESLVEGEKLWFQTHDRDYRLNTKFGCTHLGKYGMEDVKRDFNSFKNRIRRIGRNECENGNYDIDVMILTENNWTLNMMQDIDSVKIEILKKISYLLKRLCRYLARNQKGSLIGTFYSQAEFDKVLAEIRYYTLMVHMYGGNKYIKSMKSVKALLKQYVDTLHEEVQVSYQPMFGIDVA